jgi:hypothetical protein
MSERFELLDIEGDISGKLRLIYSSGPADPAPFVLTLTPQYVARASGRPIVSDRHARLRQPRRLNLGKRRQSANGQREERKCGDQTACIFSLCSSESFSLTLLRP